MTVDEELTTADLAGFKSGRLNFKLALWDPRANGLRYLKSLTYRVSGLLRPADRERLRRIEHRDLGDPITVRHDGDVVCLDYLRAVFEVEFLAARLTLTGMRIVEIGAGYGRTCHAILSNFDVAEYHIVERPETLELSRAYLRAVLPDDKFAKLSFHRADELDDVFAADVDLCINIDSFAVMEPGIVRNYLSLIAAHSRYFYVNGPVGKYLDKELDNHSQGAEQVAAALSTGLLRDVLDIYDSAAVAEHAGRFLTAYLPDARWVCAAEGETPVWSHYWQSLYRKVR